jgi:hypothetical protein
MGRIVLAGIAGGFAMFVMMSILHMSPIAQAGFSKMSDDGAVIAALQTATDNKPGLYFYPYVDMHAKDAMAKSEAALKANPSGILIYQPAGASGMNFKRLFTEFAAELVQAFIAAALLAFTMIPAYGGRVGFVTLVGLVSVVTTNVSYWNWYAFPATFTLANMAMELAGFFAAGLAIAAIVRPKTA